MVRSGVAALCVAVFLAVFEIGSCVRCYQCNSESDKNCGDPFYATTKVVDCSLPSATEYNRGYLNQILPSDLLTGIFNAPRYCHKIVMKTGTIVRTCLDANPNDLNQTCRQVNNIAKQCSVCDKDLCNGVGTASLSYPLAFLALVASYLIYKQ